MTVVEETIVLILGGIKYHGTVPWTEEELQETKLHATECLEELEVNTKTLSA